MSAEPEPFHPVLYRERWFMLAMFCCCSMSNAYHWIHLNIISDRILYIWNVSIPGHTITERQFAVDSLSTVFMIAYIPLIIPAMWLLDRHGLRITMLLAAILNALGGWLKCVGGVLAVDPSTVQLDALSFTQWSAFPMLTFAQTIDAVAQVFILGIPAALAVTWFGDREISTATALGVLANQLGVALGFCIPPMIVASPIPTNPSNTSNQSTSPSPPSSQDNTMIESDYNIFHQHMMYLLYIGAAINTLPAVPVLFCFKKEPPIDPTFTQHQRKRTCISLSSSSCASTLTYAEESLNDHDNPSTTNPVIAVNSPENSPISELSPSFSTFDRRVISMNEPLFKNPMSVGGFRQQLCDVFRNRHFMILLTSYGVIIGVFYALGTLLNVILQTYFPGNVAIGWIGFTMIVAGMLGSILIGIALDRTRRYRIIALLIYALALLWMGGLTGLLLLRSLLWIFLAIGFLGFAMTGFLTIGFEYAAELTYPASEGLTSGLINAAAQIFGVIFIFVASHLTSINEVFYTNVLLTALLFIGFVLMIFVKEDLRRFNCQKNRQVDLVAHTNADLAHVS